jgi:hypothetical protein
MPIASFDPLARVLSMFGPLGVCAWLSWRFGPTLLRVTGWCSWWVAWACGSQGGYGYCVAFLVLGTVAWGGGTVWYARRRGRWPSTLSARALTRLLGTTAAVPRTELHSNALRRRRQRRTS